MAIKKGTWDMALEMRKVDPEMDAPSPAYVFSGGRVFYEDAPNSQYYHKRRRRKNGLHKPEETKNQEGSSMDASVPGSS